MKKLAIFLLVLLLAFLPVFSVFADETATKTVDGRYERWEQEEYKVLNTLATMTWKQEEDTLHFSGTGYGSRPELKFGFRSSIAFSNTEWSVKIKFPDTFPVFFIEGYPDTPDGNNMHFAIAYTNDWKAWWNTDNNATKGSAFIVRPISNDKVTVELAGRWGASNTGYGDLSTVKVAEYTLDATRTLELGFKKNSDGVISTLVNGNEHGKLDKVLKDGKTMSDFISEFEEGKGYLQFGASLHRDLEKLALEYTITAFSGALDAFKELDTQPGTDVNPPPISQDTGVAGGRISVINWNYVILYGISGACGIGALVCFILSKFRKV